MSSTFTIPQRFPYHWLLFKWLDLMMQARDNGELAKSLSRAQAIYSFLRPAMKAQVEDPNVMFRGSLHLSPDVPVSSFGMVSWFEKAAKTRGAVKRAIDEVVLSFSAQVMAVMDKAGMLDMYRTSVYETSEEG